MYINVHSTAEVIQLNPSTDTKNATQLQTAAAMHTAILVHCLLIHITNRIKLDDI